MSGRARLAVLATVLVAGCVIDLDHLSGGTAGSGGETTSVSTGGHAGGGAGGTGPGGADAGDGGCSLLDCSCVSGPEVVAAGAPFADSPRGVAVASDALIWVDEVGGAVVRAPASGSGPAKVTDAHTPRAVDVHGSRVVWTAQEGLFSCTLPACGDKGQVFGAAAPDSMRDVAYDGLVAVWSDFGSGLDTGKVLACSLSSCNPYTLQDSMNAAGGVALSGGRALWVDRGNGNQNGSVSTSPETSASLMQITAGRDLPTGVAADDTYAYWTEQVAGGHVYRCAFAGAPCTTGQDIAPAAGGFPRPRDVRLAGGRIYWSSTDDGSIRSCPEAGCGSAMPKVHVTGRASIQRMVVGTSCLFWTEDGNGGAVMRAPR